MTRATSRPAPQITLGWRLRMAMEYGGLKADDMARELGVHRGTITRWTHDVGAQPRTIYLQRWADLCAVSVDWLVSDLPTPEGQTASNRGLVTTEPGYAFEGNYANQDPFLVAGETAVASLAA